jgi:hypothetical protein
MRFLSIVAVINNSKLSPPSFLFLFLCFIYYFILSTKGSCFLYVRYQGYKNKSNSYYPGELSKQKI